MKNCSCEMKPEKAVKLGGRVLVRPKKVYNMKFGEEVKTDSDRIDEFLKKKEEDIKANKASENLDLLKHGDLKSLVGHINYGSTVEEMKFPPTTGTRENYAVVIEYLPSDSSNKYELVTYDYVDRRTKDRIDLYVRFVDDLYKGHQKVYYDSVFKKIVKLKDSVATLKVTNNEKRVLHNLELLDDNDSLDFTAHKSKPTRYAYYRLKNGSQTVTINNATKRLRIVVDDNEVATEIAAPVSKPKRPAVKKPVFPKKPSLLKPSYDDSISDDSSSGLEISTDYQRSDGGTLYPSYNRLPYDPDEYLEEQRKLEAQDDEEEEPPAQVISPDKAVVDDISSKYKGKETMKSIRAKISDKEYPIQNFMNDLVAYCNGVGKYVLIDLKYKSDLTRKSIRYELTDRYLGIKVNVYLPVDDKKDTIRLHGGNFHDYVDAFSILKNYDDARTNEIKQRYLTLPPFEYDLLKSLKLINNNGQLSILHAIRNYAGIKVTCTFVEGENYLFLDESLNVERGEL